MDGVLDLHAGELVEVRSEAEILRTLDSKGSLDALPFMPEMTKFCGRRFRVYKRADKVCDTIDWRSFLRLEHTVHLEDLRCDGAAHGGCQAACLLHWKEAWLRRVQTGVGETTPPDDADSRAMDEVRRPAACTSEIVLRMTRRETNSGEDVFSCQATEMLHASTSELPWWKLGQYVRDIRSRNASVGRVIRDFSVGVFNRFQETNMRFLPRWTLIHGGRRYPFIDSKLIGATPASGKLNLQPGDLVEVKSKEEIFETLNQEDKQRGLRFDGEMLKYCGRRGRVRHRVERIIDEKSGMMIPIKSDCIVIEGFICSGDYHRCCPRASFTWWRESWLRRVTDVDPESAVILSGA